MVMPFGVQRNPLLPENLAKLLASGKFVQIPTNYGWTSAVAGTGETAQEAVDIRVITGTTASSTARLYTALYGLGSSTVMKYKVDWSKKLYMLFQVGRVCAGADAQVVARFQLKEATTEGALGAKGIGIRIDDFALVGESYGSALGAVDLATTLVTQVADGVKIILTPGVSIEYYVNEVLKGTQSTAANMPTGATTGLVYLVCSIINGAQSTLTSAFDIIHPKIWQEKG